ncbi:hypothetical protein AAE478_003492 [Parahypoxylon ruwenzoriense]
MATQRTPNLQPENENMYLLVGDATRVRILTSRVHGSPLMDIIHILLSKTTRVRFIKSMTLLALGHTNLSRRLRKSFSKNTAPGRLAREITNPVTSHYIESAPEGSDQNLISARSPLTVGPVEAAESIHTESSSPCVTTGSQISSLSTETRRQKFVREVFEQHGIRRPSGWFSDDEDLTLSGDRTASPRGFCRICHVCSTRTWSHKYCISCKHHLCAKCLCEVPQSAASAHAGFSHHPSHTIGRDGVQLIQPAISNPEFIQETRRVSRPPSTISDSRTVHYTGPSQPSHIHTQRDLGRKSELGTEGNPTPQRSTKAVGGSPFLERHSSSQSQPTPPVRRNPFTIAERTGTTTEPHTTKKLAIQRSQYQGRPHRLTGSSGSESYGDTQVECDDPMCRATHDGHYPYRHSIACALHRSEEVENSTSSSKGVRTSDVISTTRSLKSESIKDPSPAPDGMAHLHHSFSFHDHYHIVEHPAARPDHRFHEVYTEHTGVSPGHDKFTFSPGLTTKAEVRSSEYLNPLTSVEPVAKIDSFQHDREVVLSHPEDDKYPQRARNTEQVAAEPLPKVNRFPRGNNLTDPGKSVRHAKATKPPSAIREEDGVEHSDLNQSSETDTATSQSRGPKSIEFKHDSNSGRRHEEPSYASFDNHPVNEHEAIDREPRPAIAEVPVSGAQCRESIPKGHVLSPPSWLRTPSKEAGDAKSRLRHVNTKRHTYLPNISENSLREKESKHPTNQTHRSELVGDSFDEFAGSSYDLLRISAPSPSTAWHVTQHQKPESRVDHQPEHVQSRRTYGSSSTHVVEASPDEVHLHSPAGNQPASPPHGRPPTHLQARDVKYPGNKFLSPSSAHSAASRSHHSSEQRTSRDHSSLQKQPPDISNYPGTESSSFQTDANSAREDAHSVASTATTSRISPRQTSTRAPRETLLDTDDSAASRSRTPIPPPPGRPPDMEVHRPSPIAPPNHDCGWRDRYLALAAEARLLKAELSTRASLRGPDLVDAERVGDADGDDDDLGIRGVTIVVHRRGRDDIVINTDLAPDSSE